MKQVIGKLTTTILRDAIFEVGDDAVVKEGMIHIGSDPNFPGAEVWASLGSAVDQGLARLVFDGWHTTSTGDRVS